MNCLFLIPARGGSKGLPGKNIKVLNGTPLIVYALRYARLFASDSDICVSTDDRKIAETVKSVGYTIPFLRPDSLATDASGMKEVMLHALDEYERKGKRYDALILLQPTSPFRRKAFFEEALALFNKKIDMVVAVNETKANPYFNLFEENNEGYLQISKRSEAVSRQQTPRVYQYNGNLYIINPESLRLYDSLAQFKHTVKYVIPARYGIDIDNSDDWNHAEYLLKNHLVEIDGKL